VKERREGKNGKITKRLRQKIAGKKGRKRIKRKKIIWTIDSFSAISPKLIIN
jgi:hypothetical protein